MSVLRVSALSASLCCALPGCFGPLDLSDRECPCDDGWVCDTAADRCIQTGATADAGRADASARDAAPSDSGFVDGGRFDSGSVDAADAAPTDSGFDAGRVPVDAGGFIWCPTAAALCDDFESADLDRSPPWTWAAGGASRVTDMAHRGVASGRFFRSAGGASQHQIGFVPADGTATDIWVRAHIRVDSSVSVQNVGIAVIGEGVPPYQNASLILGTDGVSMYSTLAGRGWASVPLPRDRWVCYIYHAHMAVAGYIEVQIDGASLMSTIHDSRFATGANAVATGITYVGPPQTDAFEVRYDDIAVTFDGTPLSCP